MKQSLSREKIALTVSLLAVLAVLALAGLYVLQKHNWAQTRMADLEPRYARLLGLQTQQAELAQTAAAAQALLAQQSYPAAQDASQAGNDAQQRIRSIATAAGLEIVSSQVLASKPEKDFDRIPLAVRAEGPLLALQTALVALSGQSPRLVVDGLNVQTIGAVKADVPQRLAIQFSFFVLREHP